MYVVARNAKYFHRQVKIKLVTVYFTRIVISNNHPNFPSVFYEFLYEVKKFLFVLFLGLPPLPDPRPLVPRPYRPRPGPGPYIENGGGMPYIDIIRDQQQSLLIRNLSIILYYT
jgi:hypothetical protein